MTYLPLLRSLNSWFAEGVAAAGAGVVPCRLGCSACCRGPFDISPADAELVAAAVRSLPDGVRQGVLNRTVVQRTRYTSFAPDWEAPWDVAALGEDAFDALCDALADLPCPALDPETGGCLIHESRPATCRLTGLGVRTADGSEIENVCPIQDDFPTYAALAPSPLDLPHFEREAEAHDEAAAERGYVTTTVAGAIKS